MPKQTLFDCGDDTVIRFVLGVSNQNTCNVDPSMTLLRHLREIGNQI
jgi:hypothetical protein